MPVENEASGADVDWGKKKKKVRFFKKEGERTPPKRGVLLTGFETERQGRFWPRKGRGSRPRGGKKGGTGPPGARQNLRKKRGLPIAGEKAVPGGEKLQGKNLQKTQMRGGKKMGREEVGNSLLSGKILSGGRAHKRPSRGGGASLGKKVAAT